MIAIRVISFSKCLLKYIHEVYMILMHVWWKISLSSKIHSFWKQGWDFGTFQLETIQGPWIVQVGSPDYASRANNSHKPGGGGGVSYVHLDLDLTISLDHGKVRHGAAFDSSGTHTSHDHTRDRPSLPFSFLSILNVSCGALSATKNMTYFTPNLPILVYKFQDLLSMVYVLYLGIWGGFCSICGCFLL